MAFRLLVLLVISHVYFTHAFVLPNDLQTLITGERTHTTACNPPSTAAGPKRIAIIGSGITGAAAAYALSENYRIQPEPQPEVTVFERNAVVGGRITQAFAFDDPQIPVDTCAATFSFMDSCIAQAANDVGLQVQFRPSLAGGVAVWDGKEIRGFVEAQSFRDVNRWSLFRQLKWFQRYGDAPQRASMAATSIRNAFLQLLPSVPTGTVTDTRNLSDLVQISNLRDYVRKDLCTALKDTAPRTGPPVLDCLNETDSLFLREVWNAGVRERYFEDVGELPALDGLFAYESEMPVSISGGNLRLVDRLLLLSRAKVKLNSTVAQVSRSEQGGWYVKWNEQTQSPEGNKVMGRVSHFDVVILASSLNLAQLEIEPPLGDQPGLTKQLYDDSFVTHFTSSSRINGTFFSIDPETGDKPQNILTSPIRSDLKPPFFSLTLLGAIMGSDPSRRAENLYKLVSRDAVSDMEIGQYLEVSENEDPTKPLISWIDRRPLPSSVPKADFKRAVLENIEIAPDLFYAGAGEQVAATAEFGCRMGMNAAKLVSPPQQRRQM